MPGAKLAMCVLTSRDKLAHTEGDAGAAEAESIEQCLHQAQEAALDETHGGCGWQSGKMGCK